MGVIGEVDIVAKRFTGFWCSPLCVRLNISRKKSSPGISEGGPSLFVAGCGNHKPRRRFKPVQRKVTPAPSVMEIEPMFELNAAAEAVIAEARPKLSLPSFSHVW